MANPLKAVIDTYNAQELRRCLGIDDIDPLPESLLRYFARVSKSLRQYHRSALTVDNYAVIVATWQELEAFKKVLRNEAAEGDDVILIDADGKPEGPGVLVEALPGGWLKVRTPDGKLVSRRASQVKLEMVEKA